MPFFSAVNEELLSWPSGALLSYFEKIAHMSVV